MAAAPDAHDSKPPRILLDGVFFQWGGDPTGIARVWSSLLKEWAGTPFGESLFILDRAGAVPKFPGIGSYMPFQKFQSTSAAAESFILEDVCRQVKADLFVSTHLTTPLETPSLLMVHDMIPELFGHDKIWLREKRFCTYHAAAYVAVSQKSANDLYQVYPLSKRAPVCIAHDGVSALFHPPRPDFVQAFRKAYGISNPYFLLVGSRKEHKNAELFFRAFSRLPNKQCFSIVCCGGDSVLEDELSMRAHGCDVKMLRLADEELNAAYAGAICLVFPSKYEGFGLPIVEAMAAGCPVITCPNAAIPEVAAGAALYVNDSDVAGMLDALNSIQSDEVRSPLIQAGLRRSQQFSWTKMARTVATFSTEVLRCNLAASRTASSRRWRELRNYQRRANATLRKFLELESAWLKAITEQNESTGVQNARRTL